MDPTAFLASQRLHRDPGTRPTSAEIDQFYQTTGWTGFAILSRWRRRIRWTRPKARRFHIRPVSP